MKKNKKKKVEVIMHQHIDEKGNVIGKLHPISSIHNKITTMNSHKRTRTKELGGIWQNRTFKGE